MDRLLASWLSVVELADLSKEMRIEMRVKTHCTVPGIFLFFFLLIRLTLLEVIRHQEGQMNSSIPILNAAITDYYMNNGHHEEARQLFERLVIIISILNCV